MEALIYKILLVVLSGISLVVLYNLLSFPYFRKQKVELKDKPLVSLLIPARNEEAVIEQCLDSVLFQTYPDYEVLVLDDQSTDRTFEKAQYRASRDARLTVIQGTDLPDGWLGKNWACHQLSEAASGSVLIFVDAECILSSWTIESAVSILVKNRLSLLSTFPAQKLLTLGERLIVPSMNWLLLSFLPLKFVYLFKNHSLVAANGQFMAFERESYEKAGGHRAVRGELVEDMELARRCKRYGLRIMTLLGGDTVQCRMYNSFSTSFNGFSKNFFPGFKVPLLIFSMLLVLILLIFFVPCMLLYYDNRYSIPVALIVIQRVGISISVRENPLFNIIFHPLQMVIMVMIGINSMRIFKGKKIYWKGRKV